MQATTCGEIHKVDIYSKELIGKFLKKESQSFNKFNNERCLYQDASLINDPSLNYLNLLPEDKINLSLKNLILNEYTKCEKMYPYLGDYFLSRFFKTDKKSKSSSLKKFNKNMQAEFLKGINDINVKNIFKWITKNTNLARSINIVNYPGSDIIFESLDNFTFELSYDFDFYVLMKDAVFKNFNFIIIDGYIESVGEIHHLLHSANKNKEPYVVICYGMHEEVKKTIIKNNVEGRLIVLPVSLDVNDEGSLNILNDLACVLEGDVVSSQLGQTISQEVRKQLKKGKRIQFLKNKIIVEPVANKQKLNTHRSFLKKRIDDATRKGDVNIDPLKKRLKMFSAKRINLYIPNDLTNNKEMTRELDYIFRFMSMLNSDFYKIDFSSRKNYFIPINKINFVESKVESLQNIFNNIKVIIA